MTDKEIVKSIMKEKGIGNAEAANALGLTPATMWDRLNGKKNSLTVTKLNEILRYLGYDLVIMPRGKANRIDGAMIVESPKPAIQNNNGDTRL